MVSIKNIEHISTLQNLTNLKLNGSDMGLNDDKKNSTIMVIGYNTKVKINSDTNIVIIIVNYIGVLLF